MIRGVSLILFALILSAGIAAVWPIWPARAAECDTFDSIRKQMVKEGHIVTMLAEGEVAAWAERYSVADPGRGFTVERNGYTLLGIEVGKCILPPMDISGQSLRMSGRTTFGVFA